MDGEKRSGSRLFFLFFFLLLRFFFQVICGRMKFMMNGKTVYSSIRLFQRVNSHALDGGLGRPMYPSLMT